MDGETPDVLYIGRVELDASETSVHQRLGYGGDFLEKHATVPQLLAKTWISEFHPVIF